MSYGYQRPKAPGFPDNEKYWVEISGDAIAHVVAWYAAAGKAKAPPIELPVTQRSRA